MKLCHTVFMTSMDSMGGRGGINRAPSAREGDQRLSELKQKLSELVRDKLAAEKNETVHGRQNPTGTSDQFDAQIKKLIMGNPTHEEALNDHLERVEQQMSAKFYRE